MVRRSPITPTGVITRGTTGVNRLRRSDRWLIHDPTVREVLLQSTPPLVVDLGYGNAPITTLEMARRLRTVRPDVRVIGLEIDPDRVVDGQEGVDFRRGGFELAGLRPHLVRAFNVLRQYPVGEVAHAWPLLQAQVDSAGLIIDGTCDELGRRCAWVLLNQSGPISLTLAWDPMTVARPSDIAERLPKILIHRNVPGEPIHSLLAAADTAWDRTASHAPFGPRVRWRAALTELISRSVPVLNSPRKVRDCLLTVPWHYVAPLD